MWNGFYVYRRRSNIINYSQLAWANYDFSDASTITRSGSSITLVSDKSPSGYNISSVISPTNNGGTINGKSVALFNNNQLRNNNISFTGNNIMIFFVGTIDSISTSFGRAVSLQSSDATVDWNNPRSIVGLVLNGTTANIGIASNLSDTFTSISYSTPILISAGIVNGTTFYIGVNGTLTPSTNLTGSTGLFSSEYLSIGRHTSGSESWNGLYGEIAIFSFYDLDFKQKVEGNLAYKWWTLNNASNPLPNNHPYRNL